MVRERVFEEFNMLSDVRIEVGEKGVDRYAAGREGGIGIEAPAQRQIGQCVERLCFALPIASDLEFNRGVISCHALLERPARSGCPIGEKRMAAHFGKPIEKREPYSARCGIGAGVAQGKIGQQCRLVRAE